MIDKDTDNLITDVIIWLESFNSKYINSIEHLEWRRTLQYDPLNEKNYIYLKSSLEAIIGRVEWNEKLTNTTFDIRIKSL